jgi:hypothetical protein
MAATIPPSRSLAFSSPNKRDEIVVVDVQRGQEELSLSIDTLFK